MLILGEHWRKGHMKGEWYPFKFYLYAPDYGAMG